MLEKRTLEYPDNEAADGMAYSELHDVIDRYVAGLKTAGIQKQDAVCLFLASKSVHATALGLAILRLGATYIPLSSTLPDERLGTQCRALGKAVKLLLYGDEEIDRVRAEALASTLRVPVGSIGRVWSEYRNISDHSSWDGLALFLFTSGSAGTPKATGYRHRHLVSALEACTATSVNTTSSETTTRTCNVAPWVRDVASLDLFGPFLCDGAGSFAHQEQAITQTIVEKE